MRSGKRAGQAAQAKAARRTGGLDVTTILALLLPVVTIGALALVRPDTPAVETHPPTSTSLANAAVVCPQALPASGKGAVVARVASDQGTGSVSVTEGEQETSVPVAPGRPGAVPGGTGPLVVRGAGRTAPGLVAGRFGASHIAALDCPGPVADQWYTGLGVRAVQTSVLELTNPDAGPAVADVTVLAGGGPVDAPRLRGIGVPAHTTLRLDLGTMIPRRSNVALHVVTSRGRVASAIEATYQPIAERPSRDWVPAQATPATSNLLLGLPSGTGQRLLLLANPGEDEARADVKVVTEDTEFAPEGLDEVRVPPQSVVGVPLTNELAKAVKDGAVGVHVTSSVPLTAMLRSSLPGDLAITVPDQPVAQVASVLLPDGRSTVLLNGEKAGTATVTSWSATGRKLDDSTVEISGGHTTSVDLPATAALVRVVPERTSVSGAVLVAPPAKNAGKLVGAAVIPLRELQRVGLVPAVRPGVQ